MIILYLLFDFLPLTLPGGVGVGDVWGEREGVWG